MNSDTLIYKNDFILTEGTPEVDQVDSFPDQVLGEEPIDLKNLVDDPKKLKTYDTHISPKEALVKLRGGEIDEHLLVRAVAKSAQCAYLYARDVLKGAFPLGEPTIATDALYSYVYATDVLKGPFPLGEKSIFDSPYRYLYAKEVLQDRPWTGLDQKVDEAMDLKKLVTHPKKLKTYHTHISPEEAYYRLLGGERDEYLVRAIKTNSYYSYLYAQDVLKGPFPLGEPAIATDATASYWYAKYILKDRFPLGEPAIATDDFWKQKYEDQILKGKPWPELKKKTTEAIDLKNLVDDPKKLKTYDTHIGPKEAYDRLKKGEKDEYLVRAVAKAKDPRYAYYYAKDILKGPFPLGEPAIAKHPMCAHWYALYVLKGPFPLGEPAIAKYPYYAYEYARWVLKGPWPQGEPAIAKDPEYAYQYAIDVLKGPWPPGEPAIATDAMASYWYAKYILKDRFPLGEPAIATDDFWKQKYEDQILKGKPWPELKKKTTEAIDLKNLVDDPKKLKTYHTHISPEEAYTRLENGDKDPILLKVVAKDPRYAYYYAKDVLKGPFPLGEPAIAKHPYYAHYYALNVLKGPFPLGESEIAKDPAWSFFYARDVLKNKPFPLGEPAIAKSPNYAYYYATGILQGRPWTGLKKKKKKKTTEAIDLKNLVSDPKKLKTYDTHISPKEAYDRLLKGEKDEYLVRAVATSSKYAYWYAEVVLKGPFPLGEPIIAKHPAWSFFYATDILKKPFPLGEPAIAKDPDYAYIYARDILKGKPWPELNKKTTEAMDLKNLVDDPKKLKTYDTHISPKEAYEQILMGNEDPIYVNAIARDSDYASWYAENVLKGPFPLGEPAIAKNESNSYRYAVRVLKKPFPLGEKSIKKSPYFSFFYAGNVIKGSWPKGEPAIRKNQRYSRLYQKYILQGEPWTYKKKKTTEAMDLKKLVTDPSKISSFDTHRSPKEAYTNLSAGNISDIDIKIVSKDPEFAFLYAALVLKGPFPLGEPAIAKNGWYAARYANVILNKPWPLAEPVIYNSPWWFYYEREVLNGLPWTNITQPVTEALDLKKLVTYPKKLKTYDTHISSEEAYNRLREGETDEYLVRAVAKHPGYAYLYAKNIKGAFPLGEPAIATDAANSYYYAKYVLERRFPLGEPEIYKDEFWRHYYKKEILKSRPWAGLKKKKKTTEAIDLKNLVTHPKKLKTYDTHISAEEAYDRLKNGDKDPILVKVVAKDPNYAYEYARFVLKSPFPLGEPIIAKHPVYAYHYARDVLKGPFPLGEPIIAKHTVYAYYYAKDILKGPFPLVEPIIAKDPRYAYYYAKNMLKGPWPLGEPAIATQDFWKEKYEDQVLKGRPWTGLDQTVDEAMDLKNLVSDPKKLKTYDTHLNAVETVKYKIENGVAPTQEDLTKIYNETNKQWGPNIWLSQQDKILNFNDILKYGKFSYLFAKNILNGPFPLGEKTIATSPSAAAEYAAKVLQDRFPLGEPKILTSPYWAYFYADQVIKGPWPIAEPIIAEDSYYAFEYSKYVLKAPFPMAEEVIYDNKYTRMEYETLWGSEWKGIEGDLPDDDDPDLFTMTEAMNLKDLVSDPKKLKTYDTHIGPEEAYHRSLKGDKDPILAKAVAKSPKYSYLYAYYVLKGPFPLGEPAIAKSAEYSFLYAKEVLKSSFPLGEPAISKDSWRSFGYAIYVLKKPFLLGEPAIAKDTEYSYIYARDILEGPFPLAEPTIANSAYCSYLYAKDVLQGPWPPGEPTIARDSYHKSKYEQYVLKGRPWTGLEKKKKTTEAIDLKNLVSDPTKLKTYDTHISPKEAYYRLRYGDKDPILVKAVAKDTRYAYFYAHDILKGPFPLGEPAIAKDTTYAYWYARDVLKGPFPLGEPEIAEDQVRSFYYARNILEGPFPLGEPAIAKDPQHAYQYARYVLEKPFPLGEPAIAKDSYWKQRYKREVLKGRPWTGLKKKKKTTEAIDLKNLVSDPTKLKTYDTHISPEEAYYRLLKGDKDPILLKVVAKDRVYAYEYARNILKGPFPLGEPAIATDGGLSYLYAKIILKGPFPLGEPEMAKYASTACWYADEVLGGPFPSGEPAIYQNSYYKSEYERKVLKDRPWTGLDQKVDEAIDLKSLVSDPTKLKTYKTHISPEEAYTRLKKGETDEYLINAVAKDPREAYYYANFILDSRFLLGEPAIAKKSYFAYHYARDVLKGPFPLGEPEIAKDPDWSFFYARNILEGPFPLGEPAIAKDPQHAYYYATEILNDRFEMGEPAMLRHHSTSHIYKTFVKSLPDKS
jgi:hypothetical protein